MAEVRIFLSTVSAEFRSYRDALRHYLERPNVTAKVQEDFLSLIHISEPTRPY